MQIRCSALFVAMTMLAQLSVETVAIGQESPKSGVGETMPVICSPDSNPLGKSALRIPHGKGFESLMAVRLPAIESWHSRCP